MSRLLIATVFLLSTYLYFPLNKRKAKYYWISPFEKYIPIISVFVVFYLIHLIMIPLAFLLLWNSAWFYPFLTSFIIANITASLFWYLFPNGVKRPKLEKNKFFDRVLAILYSKDKYDTNGFPSGHVFGSVIYSYYLALAFPALAPLFVTLGLLVSLSTLLIKQHYIIDFVGGGVWAFLSIYFVEHYF